MITLGVSVTRGSCALALVQADGVRAVHRGAVGPEEGGIPWATLRAMMQEAEVMPSQVNTIAVSGRFTPLFLRRYPTLRDRFRPKATSPLFPVAARAYETLGWSGLATVDEDRVAVWYQRLFQAHGYSQATVRMVHTSHALVSAAYIYQSHRDVHVVLAHPRGDGPPLQAYTVRDGQLRTMPLRGTALDSLRTWFEQAVTLCGFDPWSDMQGFWDAAERGTSNSALVDALYLDITGQERGAVRSRLRQCSQEEGCAAVANAAASVLATVAQELDSNGTPTLMGRLVDAPMMRGLILGHNEAVHFSPWTTDMDLAQGAAAYVAGIHPTAQGEWFGCQKSTHKDTVSVMDGSAEYATFFAGEYAVHRLLPTRALPAHVDRDTVVVLGSSEFGGHHGAIRCRASESAWCPPHVSGSVTIRHLCATRDGVNAVVVSELLKRHDNHIILETRPTNGAVSVEQALNITRREGLPGLLIAGEWNAIDV